MKKQLIVLMLFLATTTFSQTNREVLFYLTSDKLGMYDLTENQNYPQIQTLGTLANYLYIWENNLFVVTSGGFSSPQTTLEIIPLTAFNDFISTQDTSVIDNQNTIVELENSGNAYTVVGLTDSTVVVTLAATSKLQVVNFLTGEITNTISENVVGNPQGSSEINDNYVAIAMADWYAGVGNSVAVFNRTTEQIEFSIPVRLNTTDVMKLSDGNLLATSWGSWSGDENYGSVMKINPTSYEITDTLDFDVNLKVTKLIQINDSLIYGTGWDVNFMILSGLINNNTFEFEYQSEGIFSNDIVAKMKDGKLAAQFNGGIHIYDENQNELTMFESDYVNFATSTELSQSSAIHNETQATNFRLFQNYPNPFNPSTQINFNIPQDSHVKLELFNTLGEKVATLINQEMSAGSHNYQLSISNYQLPSGIYFYKLQSGSFSETKKMILMK